MILVDSNLPMYLVGAPHPHKVDAQRLLEHCVGSSEKLVTDAEVFQEILHRYVAIDRRGAIQPCWDVLRTIVDEVLTIAEREVARAKDIVLGAPHLSARDALHLAVMEHHRIEKILSFDRGFDGYPGIARIGA